jgi:hypothetical protein
MQARIMIGAGALMLAAVVLPSGVWGATMTIDEVRAEVKEMSPSVPGGKLELRFPREIHGKTRMPINQLCVSGGRLRPIKGSGSDAVKDMGPVKAGKTYQVTIVEKISSATGDEKIRGSRLVTIPDCK